MNKRNRRRGETGLEDELEKQEEGRDRVRR